MGRFTIRLPDELESEINENAANLGLSKSAYIRQALTGERDAPKELNRATIEDEIEKVGKRVEALGEIVKTVFDDIIYLSTWQREFLLSVAININGDKAAEQIMNETTAVMDKIYKDMHKEEEAKDDELSRDQRIGGGNVL